MFNFIYGNSESKKSKSQSMNSHAELVEASVATMNQSFDKLRMTVADFLDTFMAEAGKE